MAAPASARPIRIGRPSNERTPLQHDGVGQRDRYEVGNLAAQGEAGGADGAQNMRGAPQRQGA